MRADAAYWRFPEVRHLAESEVLMSLLRPLCPAVPFPVRAIYSDKSVETNWLVAWHQDLTIVVNQQAELAGYGPWSVKNGPVHVQPPAEWLDVCSRYAFISMTLMRRTVLYRPFLEPIFWAG